MKNPVKTPVKNPANAARTAAEILRRLEALGVSVRNLASDSRRVQPGDVFLACPGHHADGRAFIADAVARGALAVVQERGGKPGAGLSEGGLLNPFLDETPHSKSPRGGANQPAVPTLEVDNLAAQMGELAHLVYGQPSAKLWLAGVTGTNGKTSVSQWLMQALTHLGQRCAVIGTLGNGFPGALHASGFTTPDAPALHAALASFVTQGATACAMEVSSIGLAEGRLNGVLFDVALFTNLTRDHLDYHGTMAAYGQAKERLFTAPGLQAAVLNLDDPFAVELAAKLRGKVRTIGYTLGHAPAGHGGVDEILAAERLTMTAAGLSFDLQGQAFAAPVVGRFNASNLLAVAGALVARGENLAAIAAALRQIQPPPGRMQTVGGEDEPLVVIDYAHSSDALEKVLGVLREAATARGGRLVCVFGCGGERDPGKRPEMGAVAERLADAVVVTSDNPRHEDAQAIINGILAGMKKQPAIEVNRGRAIAATIARAHPRDVILLAGKGHEPYQEIAGVRHPFADVLAAKSALAQRRTDWLSTHPDGAIT